MDGINKFNRYKKKATFFRIDFEPLAVVEGAGIYSLTFNILMHGKSILSCPLGDLSVVRDMLSGNIKTMLNIIDPYISTIHDLADDSSDDTFDWTLQEIGNFLYNNGFAGNFEIRSAVDCSDIAVIRMILME